MQLGGCLAVGMAFSAACCQRLIPAYGCSSGAGTQLTFPFFLPGTTKVLSPSVVHDTEVQSPAGQGSPG